MDIIKVIKNTAYIAVLGLVVFAWSGCGGVSDAEMAQLNSLRDEVTSLEGQTNTLKDQRASLEKEIADKNAKLQECEKDKAETRANLMKLPAGM
jgi:septal ring factor EnvC (AmiA/AmiB activator)